MTDILPISGTKHAVWPPIARADHAQMFALLHVLEQTQWWSAEKLLQSQLCQIQSVVDHAARTVPFYATRLTEVAGLPPGKLTLEVFRQIPILTRTQVQEAEGELISRQIPTAHGQVFDVSTSGSTGRPIRVKGTDLTALYFRALSLRYHDWHRRDVTAKNVSIRRVRDKAMRGKPIPWVTGCATGQSFVLDQSDPIETLLAELIQHDPEYLQCHPHVAWALLEHAQQRGIRPQNLREVRTFGERLEPALRTVCRNQWGVAMTDMYSAEELNALTIQCPDHLHHHVQSENVYLEVLDQDGHSVKPGQMGRVVVTALHNFATPLIRYELGDLAIAGCSACPCGRGLPVIQDIIGRFRQLVTLPDGSKVFPSFYDEPVLESLSIRQYQLEQNELESIEVKLVVKRPLTADEEEILRAYIRRILHHPFSIAIEYVDEIPRSASGKFEVFRSQL